MKTQNSTSSINRCSFIDYDFMFSEMGATRSTLRYRDEQIKERFNLMQQTNYKVQQMIDKNDKLIQRLDNSLKIMAEMERRESELLEQIKVLKQRRR